MSNTPLTLIARTTARWVQHPQLFNKGARYLKLDPHWMPASFCKTQTGLRDPADPRGCMVLNHDNPTPARTGYNTTDQIVDVLTSATFQRILQKPRVLRAPRVCS